MEFSPSVASEHRRIDPGAWTDLYVVGDVHGCRRTFERLLDRYDDGESRFVVVGDLVRKGPDSKGVLDLVRDHERVVSVRGNNEQKLIDGRATPPGLTPSDVDYLRSLPLAISWDDALVVHGGVDHRKPLSEHSPTDLLTTRSLTTDGDYERPYWFETRTTCPRVFFGHTVLAEPFATPWAVGLDTGCVYGGRLTAYRCSTGEFVSVEPAETYKSRSEDSIVDPRPNPV